MRHPPAYLHISGLPVSRVRRYASLMPMLVDTMSFTFRKVACARSLIAVMIWWRLRHSGERAFVQPPPERHHLELVLFWRDHRRSRLHLAGSSVSRRHRPIDQGNGRCRGLVVLGQCGLRSPCCARRQAALRLSRHQHFRRPYADSCDGDGMMLAQAAAADANSAGKYAGAGGVFALLSQAILGGISLPLLGAIVIGRVEGAMIRASVLV